MSEDSSRRRLGRGLAALIGEIDRAPATPQESTPMDRKVPIEFIAPNPRNPRKRFAEDDLVNLANSIREHGLVQPVVVRPTAAQGRFEIIAGERRWRAAQRAGLIEVPVIIRDVDDKSALELAIIENVQRADLNAVEEAAGYQQLIDEHNYTQADLGQVIGKSRSHVANTLRLLKLPQAVMEHIINGDLTAGHARSLVTAPDPEGLALRIIEEGLSVRQAEALAAESDQPEKLVTPRRQKDADTKALEKLLSDNTGLKVLINHRNNGGDMKISYKSLEQLDEICRLLQKD